MRPAVRASRRSNVGSLPSPGASYVTGSAVFVDGGPATVGVIASVTAPFCGACDRVRLTADGQLRACLFARTETDLRSLLRSAPLVSFVRVL